jgi:amino acid permease
VVCCVVMLGVYHALNWNKDLLNLWRLAPPATGFGIVM